MKIPQIINLNPTTEKNKVFFSLSDLHPPGRREPRQFVSSFLPSFSALYSRWGAAAAAEDSSSTNAVPGPPLLPRTAQPTKELL
jgi:hypothetical protein